MLDVAESAISWQYKYQQTGQVAQSQFLQLSTEGYVQDSDLLETSSTVELGFPHITF